MSLRPIVLWPDPCLARVCTPVGPITDAVRTLARDMLDTMYDAPGRGLAAPQVGVLQRLFVMDPSWKEGAPDPMVCVDPEIVATGSETGIAEEGCLSLPGVVARVERPVAIRLAWTDLEGQRQVADLDGFAALCAQHELDHLDGIMTLDRLTAEARAELVSAYGAASA